jgi:hypothetical protein
MPKDSAKMTPAVEDTLPVLVKDATPIPPSIPVVTIRMAAKHTSQIEIRSNLTQAISR